MLSARPPAEVAIHVSVRRTVAEVARDLQIRLNGKVAVPGPDTPIQYGLDGEGIGVLALANLPD